MTTIIKIGGSILGKGISQVILSDLQSLVRKERIVLVHGGGAQVTNIAEKLGKEQKFIVSPSGIRSRFTDKETASIYAMVMIGKISKEIVAALLKLGICAVGLGGVDGGVIKANRKKRLLIIDERGRKRVIDGGYTGKISGINGKLLTSLLQEGYTPVISPVAISEEFDLLNVDGDRAAAHIAGGMHADRVIFLTNVDGVLIDGELVERLSYSQAKGFLPKIGFGMEKKVISGLEALDQGTKEAIITSGLVQDPISSALDHKRCTVITIGQ
ncbi:MAG: [LysW]-aminoadipate/[LysW]-glutamate kinase [Nitrososphaerales archaeon]